MRDRESDSWWSIMTGDAIGGEKDGTPLVEMPLGEKTTWGIWVQKHPDTLVLSVDGVQFDESKPYANYFSSDGTFRGMQIEDERLAPKEPIYSFQRDGLAFAITNKEIENGLLVEIPDDPEQLFFFYRQEGLALFGSSVALVVPAGTLEHDGAGWRFEDAQGSVQLRDGVSMQESQDALGRLASAKGVQRLEGFDTFWYTWVAVHPDSRLLP